MQLSHVEAEDEEHRDFVLIRDAGGETLARHKDLQHKKNHPALQTIAKKLADKAAIKFAANRAESLADSLASTTIQNQDRSRAGSIKRTSDTSEHEDSPSFKRMAVNVQ